MAMTTSTVNVRDEEAALIDRARGGDLPAFDHLVERYKQRIYSTIYHMTSNHADANDVAQETFIKAFKNLDRFKGDSAFYTWLYRIAVNNTINFIKRRRANHVSLDDADAGIQNDPDFVERTTSDGPTRAVAANQLMRRLNEALQKLSPNHRLVVTLYDIEGMQHGEIAKIMNCSEGTVRSRLFYARAQLQELLKDFLPGKEHE